LGDKLNSLAPPLCKLLTANNIKVCIVTKGDKKLAQIITKKHLSLKNEDNNFELNHSTGPQDILAKYTDGYFVSGCQILQDWKYLAKKIEDIDEKENENIKRYFNKIACI